jgi:hypothetical protein
MGLQTQETGSLKLRAKKAQQAQAGAGFPQRGRVASAAERAIRAVQRLQQVGRLSQELLLRAGAVAGAQHRGALLSLLQGAQNRQLGRQPRAQRPEVRAPGAPRRRLREGSIS